MFILELIILWLRNKNNGNGTEATNSYDRLLARELMLLFSQSYSGHKEDSGPEVIMPPSSH